MSLNFFSMTKFSRCDVKDEFREAGATHDFDLIQVVKMENFFEIIITETDKVSSIALCEDQVSRLRDWINENLIK